MCICRKIGQNRNLNVCMPLTNIQSEMKVKSKNFGKGLGSL